MNKCSRKKTKKILAAVAVIAIVLLAYQFFVAKPPSVGLQEEYHAHADFAQYHEDDEMVSYLDASTIARAGSEARMWTIDDYRKPLYFAVRENRVDVARFLLELENAQRMVRVA